MTEALRAYRDDGPLATGLWAVLRPLATTKPASGRLRWLAPALLRAVEYSFVAWLAARAGPATLPAAYALLAAVVFHHYDVVYRLRHQQVAPPAWVTWLGGGWEGRMLAVSVLAFAGHLKLGMVVLATWLGMLFVVESTASWLSRRRLQP